MVTVVAEGGVEDRVDPIIEIVVELLDTEGYEAVQLREVARRARVSLATIYKRYATRDELIVAALEWWMDTHRYAGLAASAAFKSDSSMY
jgi:TetR/AcrR family transcriptional regulator, cholesterol catabolism regulator